MIWKVQILRGTRRRMEFGSQNNFPTNNLLVCTSGTSIRLVTTITGGTHQYILKQHGKQISRLTGTSLGTWQCKLLMQIFLMATLKMGVN